MAEDIERSREIYICMTKAFFYTCNDACAIATVLLYFFLDAITYVFLTALIMPKDITLGDIF